MSAETLALISIPILVFLARILDVSIGTLRIIFVSKGFKNYAALLGFIESLVWILAITQVMQHMDNWNADRGTDCHRQSDHPDNYPARCRGAGAIPARRRIRGYKC